MVNKTAKLGGAASDVLIGKTAHGLMMMTWKPTPVPDDDCFAAIKAGIDALPPGVKMILTAFYGQDATPANLELVARFFHKYPSYADKVFLSVKGGTKLHSLQPDGSPENLRRSVDYILEKLNGTKSLDLFECARYDPTYPLEDTLNVLQDLVQEGKFKYIGLSEVSAATVRRAHKVAPEVAAVEIEISPWSYTQETKDVIAACAELGIAVIGYSPLGRGFLTGQIKRPDDLEEGDIRRNLSRFQEDNFKHNFAIVDALTAIATRKGITPGQLSIAWVSARGPHVVPLPGSSNVKRTLENLAGGDVELSDEDLAEIDKALETHTVKGGRYVDTVPNEKLHLWG
ncbi:aldo/keto reductase [Multifurca ochricompacta]|uniref:Aldo/keto reductase n=1 Tax=Multifurca ochricompacta TaxID=376703 RepID=A0AAD4QKR5_9AGAM|nr:aldo/keto reductase [Multifurca ochricompacta]